MSHNLYPPCTLMGISQNTLNPRSQSFVAQTCQNYPISSHLSSTHSTKPNSSHKSHYQKFATATKQNLLQPPRKSIINFSSDEMAQLKMENERLRRQMQQQKEHYQLEISKLKKNISMKDQLLDECEIEISNLKNTYHKFISQNSQKRVEKHQQIVNMQPQSLHKQSKQNSKIEGQIQSTFKVEAPLIPLSIVPKRSSPLSHLSGQANAQKLSHGLIKRVV